MLCQICHAAEATVYLIETANNKQTTMQICESCAQKKHLGEMLTKPALAIHQLLASILQLGGPDEPEGPELKCPHCSLTFSQFKEVGRFGCSECYDAFRERLLPLLRQFHQAEEHRGRRADSEQDALTALREKIRQAVAQENFEQAARLRDQIKALGGTENP